MVDTMRHKAVKETQLGTYIRCMSNRMLLDQSRARLQAYYEESRRKYEIDEGPVWCKYHEPEFIERLPCASGDPFDPLNQYATIAIKWRVVGRAFYIKRTFRKPVKFKRHPNKKNVPKKLRGKPIVQKNNNDRAFT